MAGLLSNLNGDFMPALMSRDGQAVANPSAMQMPGGGLLEGLGGGGLLSRLGKAFDSRPEGHGWADKLMMISAGLKDAGGGEGNLQAMLKMRDDRRKAQIEQQEAQRKQELAQRAAADFGGGQRINLQDPATQAKLLQYQTDGFDISPILELAKAGQAPARRIIETPEGIKEQQDDGTWRLVDKYAPTTLSAPSGMRFNEQGGLEWIPGYVEAMGRLTGARRDAVVSRPMPRAGGGGRRAGGAGGSGAPAGRVLGPTLGDDY